MIEQRNILRNGTVGQRRQLLRVRQVRVPDNVEAAAVLGTAVLDLPASDMAGESTDRCSGAIVDARPYLASCCGGGDKDGTDGIDCVDYSSLVEVLCPDGTSLLERLPLSPVPARRGRVVSPSPRRHSATRSPLFAASTPFTFATAGDSLATPQEESVPQPAPPPPHNRNEQGDGSTNLTYADGPVRLHDSFDVSYTTTAAAVAAAVTPTQRAERDDADDGLHIFASGGSCTLVAPRNSARHRRRRRAPAQSSPASCRDSQYLSLGSADRHSSNGRSGFTTPAEQSMRGLTPTSVACTPLSPHERCDLNGRVLLTDRLVQSQSSTALPKMIAAYQQYVQATSASTCCPSALPSKNSRCKWRGNKTHEKEELAALRQALAPRQRGIVLQADNTDEEVLKCVTQAQEGVRPSFRYMDPAEVYGTSSYRSNTFIQQSEN